MADIELDNINEQEQVQEQELAEREEEEEETSFTENTNNNYDNTRSQISSEPTVQTRVDLNDFVSTDLERRLAKDQQDKEMRREGAIQILRILTGENLGDYGDNSRELFDGISEVKFSNKGKLTALKFKGEDANLTKKGEIDGRYTQNKGILKAIENAKVEYNTSFDSVVNDSVGFSLSDEAVESVRENAAENFERMFQDKRDEIFKNDLDGNTYREINGIIHVDDGVDYDNLEDPNQKTQLLSKIDGLNVEIKNYEDRAEKEQDPVKKQVYKTAKDACIAKKSEMEARAGIKPTSEEALSMIQEEAKTNDLTRFERFKKWAKENIAGVSAVAISIAGIITTVVIAGRNAIKKAAKPIGQFGKALANIAKKAGPAIAAILNVLAQVLTWGAKALEFLSRNLWIVALFLTYLLYDTVKERVSAATDRREGKK